MKTTATFYDFNKKILKIIIVFFTRVHRKSAGKLFQITYRAITFREWIIYCWKGDSLVQVFQIIENNGLDFTLESEPFVIIMILEIIFCAKSGM